MVRFALWHIECYRALHVARTLRLAGYKAGSAAALNSAAFARRQYWPLMALQPLPKVEADNA